VAGESQRRLGEIRVVQQAHARGERDEHLDEVDAAAAEAGRAEVRRSEASRAASALEVSPGEPPPRAQERVDERLEGGHPACLDLDGHRLPGIVEAEQVELALGRQQAALERAPTGPSQGELGQALAEAAELGATGSTRREPQARCQAQRELEEPGPRPAERRAQSAVVVAAAASALLTTLWIAERLYFARTPSAICSTTTSSWMLATLA
jgi:hypothetical protein